MTNYLFAGTITAAGFAALIQGNLAGLGLILTGMYILVHQWRSK